MACYVILPQSSGFAKAKSQNNHAGRLNFADNWARVFVITILTFGEAQIIGRIVLNLIAFSLFLGAIGYNPGIATVLTLVCSDSPKEINLQESSNRYRTTGQTSLPQGAFTSPSIANLITRNLDNQLQLYVDKAG